MILLSLVGLAGLVTGCLMLRQTRWDV
ncbi:hypothetical protein BRAS3809_6820007 [Bradyrhizobium sp. STM 3809]|nr:hypothetical protein BRAS3809_6820007 [Bradyrhizobium sp. STM 3809]